MGFEGGEVLRCRWRKVLSRNVKIGPPLYCFLLQGGLKGSLNQRHEIIPSSYYSLRLLTSFPPAEPVGHVWDEIRQKLTERIGIVGIPVNNPVLISPITCLTRPYQAASDR